MTEWTVVTVIVVLVGLVAAIVKPLINLNTIITRLSVIVGEVEKNLSGLTEKNSDAHGKLWGKLEEQDDTLSNHETRIQIIEKQKAG